MPFSRIAINIEDINNKNSENVYRFVARGEGAFKEQITEIASCIKQNGKKIILICGPSSSGKTTSSRKISEELKEFGLQSCVMNMDNFFRDLDTVPKLENGKPDMEGIVALDVECVQKCLFDILKHGETMIPEFDFATHKRKLDWNLCKLKKNEILILEGIHALNPQISLGLDKSKIMKIYVHCNTDFFYENKLILPARDLRLLRRIIRDERDRHTPILQTIEMWDEVCLGEDKNIRPYKGQADYFLNSTHFYEPLLYKGMLLKELEKVADNPVASGFLRKFKCFSIIEPSFVPNDSLIREFIGESW